MIKFSLPELGTREAQQASHTENQLMLTSFPERCLPFLASKAITVSFTCSHTSAWLPVFTTVCNIQNSLSIPLGFPSLEIILCFSPCL